jgi:hypothetical protein
MVAWSRSGAPTPRPCASAGEDHSRDRTRQHTQTSVRTLTYVYAGARQDFTSVCHAAAEVPAATTGRDAAKKVPVRKRGLAVDVLGLVIAVVVLAASVHDNAVGAALLNKVAAGTSTVTKALVDQGFKKTMVDDGADLGIAVEVVERNPADHGFVPQPICWRVELTNGILMLHRRLVRDYEHRPASSESRVHWAISDVMTRRLTGTSTPSWRGARAATHSRPSVPCCPVWRSASGGSLWKQRPLTSRSRS